MGHYYAPVSWKKLCTPKNEGGLGFRCFWSLDQVSLAKLAWWVLTKRNSLCVQTLLSKYKVRGNWLNHNSISSKSWIWKGIENAKQLLSKGACMMVGDGNNILVWSDPWIPDCEGFIPRSKEDNNSIDCLVVSQLFNPSCTGWDELKLQSLFGPRDVQAIKRISISTGSLSDRWVWIKSVDGEFSVKSAYWNTRLESEVRAHDSLRNNIWKSHLHERLKMLLCCGE